MNGGVKEGCTNQAWTIGDSSFASPVPQEVEECMIGMKRGAIRWIELPFMIVYKVVPKENRLPLPSEMV